MQRDGRGRGCDYDLLSATGSSGELEEIGDDTYDWADVGTLYGKVSDGGAAPCVGVGWGNIMDKDKRWGFYSYWTYEFAVAF